MARRFMVESSTIVSFSWHFSYQCEAPKVFHVCLFGFFILNSYHFNSRSLFLHFFFLSSREITSLSVNFFFCENLSLMNLTHFGFNSKPSKNGIMICKLLNISIG